MNEETASALHASLELGGLKALGSDWRDWDAALRYEGLPIQVISIDNTGRDAMKERWGEDILPKTKWMVKMDCDKRWKERATSGKSRGCGEM
jgi:hypothetical protein